MNDKETQNNAPAARRGGEGAAGRLLYHDRYRAGGRKAHVRHEAAQVHHAARRRGGYLAARCAGAAAGEAQGSIRIAPLITSPMTTLVQSKYLTHDCSLSLMAATTRNALSMNHAPIITSSVPMDGAENGGLTWVTRWKEPLSRTAVMFRRQDRFRRMPATSICVLWA